MDTIRINPAHVSKFNNGIICGNDENYSQFDEDTGRLKFSGDARPYKFYSFSSEDVKPYHHAPLTFQSLAATGGITTDGLTTSTDASRHIEVFGINDGIHTKGILNSAYDQKDTAHLSDFIKIRLTTMHGLVTWDQTTPWRLILDIADGDIEGKFTIFMPAFSLLEYSIMELYVTIDGATYITRSGSDLGDSMCGSEAATELMVNNESSGSDIIIQVASTTGFYEGNEVHISDSESGEVSRIKNIVSNTSITVDTLINSYTTINGAKLDIIDYTRTLRMTPQQRGLIKLGVFKPNINSGITFQFGLPWERDENEDIEIILNYIGSEGNSGADTTKWRVQYHLAAPGDTMPDGSIQYGSLAYSDIIPYVAPVPVAYLGDLHSIPPSEHAAHPMLSIEVIRNGTDSGDTYGGDIRLIAVVLKIKENKMGYVA